MERKAKETLSNYGYRFDTEKCAAFYRGKKGALGKPLEWFEAIAPHVVIAYDAGKAGFELEDIFPYIVPESGDQVG